MFGCLPLDQCSVDDSAFDESVIDESTPTPTHTYNTTGVNFIILENLLEDERRSTVYNRVARFSTFFSDRLGTNGKSCVPMPVKEPYNLFDLG